MAKSQKRSNREVRKPKTDKAKPAAHVAISPLSPVSNALHKPKGKL